MGKSLRPLRIVGTPVSQKVDMLQVWRHWWLWGQNIRVQRQCVLENSGVDNGLAINRICYLDLVAWIYLRICNIPALKSTQLSISVSICHCIRPWWLPLTWTMLWLRERWRFAINGAPYLLGIICGSSVHDESAPFPTYLDPVVGWLHLEHEGVSFTLLSTMNLDTTAWGNWIQQYPMPCKAS